ncbi:MAG: hypothetical protein AAFQ52_21240, partial [Chloroflexota bacterium]
MSIIYRWEIPNRVLWVDVGAKMSLAEVHAMDNTLTAYLDACDKPLHIIFDNTTLATFPTDVRVLAATVQFPKHPNLGWRVIYGESKLVRFLGQLSSKIIAATRFRYVDDLTTAYAFLQSI